MSGSGKQKRAKRKPDFRIRLFSASRLASRVDWLSCFSSLSDVIQWSIDVFPGHRFEIDDSTGQTVYKSDSKKVFAAKITQKAQIQLFE